MMIRNYKILESNFDVFDLLDFLKNLSLNLWSFFLKPVRKMSLISILSNIRKYPLILCGLCMFPSAFYNGCI